MKRANVGQETTALRVLAEEREHAAAHFAGGFIGERYGQDMAGIHFFFGHQISQAVREGLGLARAGAGQNQDRTIGGDGGDSLGFVEFF